MSLNHHINQEDVARHTICSANNGSSPWVAST